MNPLPVDPTEQIVQEYLELKKNGPKRSSKERFAEDVRRGLIDSKGRLTKLFCGAADPEPEKADEILKQDWGTKGEQPW